MRSLSSLAVAALLLNTVATVVAATKIDEARELQRQGKLDASHDLLSAAAIEFRESHNDRDLATALGIAADMSVSLGHYDTAIQEVSEALKLRVALHEEASIGDDYNTLGLAYQYLGNYAMALDRYRKALDADRAAHDIEGEATRLNNIGNLFYFQGRYSEALRSYEDALQKPAQRELTLANLAVLFQRLGQEQRALDYYRRLSPQTMPASERAQSMVNQGVLYRRLGDPVKALELYRAASALFATDRHRDGEIGALRNIGITLALDLNNLPGALDAFTRALHLAQQSANQRAIAQASLYRGELLHRTGHADQATADLRVALAAAQSAGLVEEQWRSLHALGRIDEEAGRASAAEDKYRGAISVIESMRASLRIVSLRSDFLADKRDVYDSLIALRLRDPLATPGEIFEWMERSRARTLLDRVRNHVTLTEPQLAVVQARLQPSTVLVEYWIGKSSAAALWITQTGAGIVRHDSLASDAWLAGIPLAEHLIVVPDGALSSTPFESLPVPGSNALVIEQSDVSYLPSARFLSSTPRRKWLAPWATEIMTLADPPADSNSFDERWDPLPGSADEARAIAKILPGRAQLRLGEDAQKRFLIEKSRAPLLHLGTHAMIDAENPDRSRILLAHDYLFQEEVYDLDLSGVDLVTLSACDTARGTFVRGENVQAFSQAFLASGAAATVTTLWRVADRPTAEFMKQFYFALANGESKAGALRSAKLRFLRSNSPLADPRYWAAFVLTGDGSSPIPRAISWTTCLIAAVGLLVTFAALSTLLRAARKSRETV